MTSAVATIMATVNLHYTTTWKGICVSGCQSEKSLYPLLFDLFQFLDVMAEFKCWAQLQPHVLHNDITAQ